MGDHYTISGISNSNYGSIPSNSSLNKSGSGNLTMNAVGYNTQLNLGGIGAIVVKGDVGHAVQIDKSGSGTLHIQGAIGDKAKLNLDGIGNITIDGPIADDAVITKSGSSYLHVRDSLGGNANLILGGIGDINIGGTIASGTQIIKSGSGSLFIKGKVDASVRITISGIGSVHFTHRPPEAVIKHIQKSGSGSIQMPGGYQQPQACSSSNSGNVISGSLSIISMNGEITVTRNGVTRKYKGKNASFKNNCLVIDERVIDETAAVASSSQSWGALTSVFSIIPPLAPMPSLLDSSDSISALSLPSSSPSSLSLRSHEELDSFSSGEEESPRLCQFSSTNSGNNVSASQHSQMSAPQNHASSSSAVAPRVESNPHTFFKAGGFSAYTQAYINSFAGKIKISETLLAMKLTTEEEELFEQHLDPVSYEVMNIPVYLYDRHFNLQTLLTLLEDNKPEPYTKLAFTKADIQPARPKMIEIESVIAKIEHDRKQAIKPEQLHY
ncbi:MAG: hypothetical protein P4L79_08785 [Legionella sp.]|uniref:hypothetical protein n=1 Tax=Legionella sp. TaxID=459 RepID=UPI00284EC7D3|nr:hypothetical protein [Legionella sp.]